MIGNIVYAALVLLVSAITMTTGFSFLTLSMFTLVFIRVILLKNQRLLFCSILMGMLLYARVTYMNPIEVTLSSFDNVRVNIDVKETSLNIDGDKLTFEGSIKENGRKDKVIVSYYIKNENEKEELRNSNPKSFLVEGTYSEPNEPTNFHQFNYKKYLKNKQIYYVLTASTLEVVEQNRFNQFHVYSVDSFRQKILIHVDQTMTKRTAIYTKILLFADKRSFSTDVMRTFKELGIVHLLSISGLHVVLVVEMIKKTCRRLKISTEATSTYLLLFLPLYGFTTGFGVSVFRAIGQTWLKLISEKINVPFTTLDCWSLMLISILFVQPYSIYTVGFQLSYLISFIIIMFIQQSFFKQWSKIRAYIGLNLSILICSIPVLTYHFYEFSWGVLILNSLFIPFIATVLLPMIIVNFLLSLFIPTSSLFSYSLRVLDKMIVIMEELGDGIASNVSFTIITGRLSQISYLLLLGFLVMLLLLIEKNNNKTFIIVPLVGIIMCVYSVRYTPYGQVLMIDVNQGEAILIREPWGKGNYLIDTGGQNEFTVEEWKKREKVFSVGENIMLPVLKSEGVHKLDSIIITHPDIDHYGALLDIISQIKTKQVVSAKATFLQANFQTLFPSIEKYGTIIKEVNEGGSENLPANTVAILSKDTFAGTNKNNSSLVVLGSIGNKTWLFTGDLEADGERELLAKYPNLAVDVLKVGHHGSQTSTHAEFLKQLNPEVAWISCGENNRYGHPHESVIEKITELDAMIYRTDHDGAIRYKFTDRLRSDHFDKRLFSFEPKKERIGE
ncbi:DNA internalization-related competence protein ComEC/Rec2 [Alkalibacterium sp. 20]|uniref:DNA internalization-related competence protein ComEC/Rec2 n=1 Tax=Alkalibacterium sp. 20 TaxID=1798803 RepID=UPI0009F80AF5